MAEAPKGATPGGGGGGKEGQTARDKLSFTQRALHEDAYDQNLACLLMSLCKILSVCSKGTCLVLQHAFFPTRKSFPTKGTDCLITVC